MKPKGYLFSPVESQFICSQNHPGDNNTVPLLFTIKEEKKRDFKVIKLGNKPSSKYKLHIKQNGEVQIMKGGGCTDCPCKSIYGNYMRYEKCDKNSLRQKFIWVPEHLLYDFMNDFIEDTPPAVAPIKSSHESEDQEKRREEYDILQDARNTIKAARNVIRDKLTTAGVPKNCDDIEGIGNTSSICQRDEREYSRYMEGYPEYNKRQMHNIPGYGDVYDPNVIVPFYDPYRREDICDTKENQGYSQNGQYGELHQGHRSHPRYTQNNRDEGASDGHRSHPRYNQNRRSNEKKYIESLDKSINSLLSLMKDKRFNLDLKSLDIDQNTRKEECEQAMRAIAGLDHQNYFANTSRRPQKGHTVDPLSKDSLLDIFKPINKCDDYLKDALDQRQSNAGYPNKSLDQIGELLNGNLILPVDAICDDKISTKKDEGAKLRESKQDCRCIKECIKNPKNNMCFYRADYNGQLHPIMPNRACCDSKENKCKSLDKIERLLCTLALESDMGGFSKYYTKSATCN